MFSFFARPVTGIAFGSEEVRAARASVKGTSLALLEHGEQSVPKEVAPSAEKLTLALRSLETAGHLSLKRSVVLLPAECVYTQLFLIPATAKKNVMGFVNDAVTHVIPEEFAQLKIVHRVLQDATDHTHVGVAAIRQDVLRTYQTACESDKRKIIALTTAPCAIISAHRGPKPTSFLLASFAFGQTIVTLFHHNWPIDEAILPVAATADLLMNTAESMAAEYREQGLVIEKMLLAGTLEEPSHTHTLSLEPVFPAFKDRSWLDCACASVVNPTELSVNFLA